MKRYLKISIVLILTGLIFGCGQAKDSTDHQIKSSNLSVQWCERAINRKHVVVPLWSKKINDLPIMKSSRDISSLDSFKKLIAKCPPEFIGGYVFGEILEKDGWYLVSLDPDNSESKTSLWISGIGVKKNTNKVVCFSMW